jgi:Icc-related predicted phosphoesterase
MRLWHISDTHGLHEQLPVPDGIDVVVHSGDASNRMDPYLNEPELRKFLAWFAALPIARKVFVPGNHDTSLEKRVVRPDEVTSLGIDLLIDARVEIDGVKFWGSPWTPRYGDWAWMTKRETIGRKWQHIPTDTDVLITHGPPFGTLDATYDSSNDTSMVGCRALQKWVTLNPPRFHLFGHVHSCDDIRNAGTKTVSGLRTIFSNGSCCDDGKMYDVTSAGVILDV